MKKDLSSANDVLLGLFQEGKSPLAEEFSRWQLWRQWQEVVGTTIAAQTDPVSLKDGVLYVWVKNSVWMQQLVFMVKPIKEKVNKFLGANKIQQVRFTLDRKSVPKREEAAKELLRFLASAKKVP